VARVQAGARVGKFPSTGRPGCFARLGRWDQAGGQGIGWGQGGAGTPGWRNSSGKQAREVTPGWWTGFRLGPGWGSFNRLGEQVWQTGWGIHPRQGDRNQAGCQAGCQAGEVSTGRRIRM